MTTRDIKSKKRVMSKFRWTDECQSAFDTLKQLLVSAPILMHPNMTKPFRLITDASNVGLGAILVQVDEFGNERVI